MHKHTCKKLRYRQTSQRSDFKWLKVESKNCKSLLVKLPAHPLVLRLVKLGINIKGFTKEFNARADQAGMISLYEDKSFTFVPYKDSTSCRPFEKKRCRY